MFSSNITIFLYTTYFVWYKLSSWYTTAKAIYGQV